ncbi:MAG: phosphoethanolamine transferase [Bacteroidetes bacterium]|nr:phosphoethanolamine transferase [Bacteroidota bacterium]
MKEEKEISIESNTPFWLRTGLFLWFLLSVVLLLITLKPYNKAYVTANASSYAFYNQTDSATGYVVDYSGVIDFVAYHNGKAQAEILVNQSNTYKVSVRSKLGGQNVVTLFINGVEEAHIQASKKRKTNKFTLRKNDYFKVRVVSEGDSKNEVEVKIELDNGKQQRRIYSIVFLWLVFGIWLITSTSGIHLILPSVLLVVACYNEHLYVHQSWWLPMVGFISGVVVLALIRFFIAKIRVFGRFINLILDFVLVLTAVGLSGFVWNYKRYGYKMDYDTIIAVLQSNFSETIEFAFSEAGVWPILGVIVLVLVPLVLFLVGKKVSDKPLVPNHIYWFIISATLSYLCIQESKFIGESFQAYTQYYEEIEKFNEVQQRFNKQSNVEAVKSETGETYVFVIGESQSKEHMSVYGYHRPTTPFLDSIASKGEIALFQNAYSSHTHTIMVLRDALTQSNQYNSLKYTDVPSLINVLNSADFETVWLSNQVMLSNWDNIVSAIAASCEKKVYVNKNIGESMRNSPFDERLLPEFEALVEKPSKRNRAIFVHVLGNHGQYSERYPNSFMGLPSRGKADFGGDKDVKVWEAYDNSILYSDFILSQFHKYLDEAPGEVKILTYFSDHAEDLSGGRGHNSGQFTYRMTQIPMYVWANDGYKQRYKNKWNRVVQAKDRLFSNDLFFQLALDLTDVESNLMDSKFNVIHPAYQIDTFKTKSGAVQYINANNPYANASINVNQLEMLDTLGRVGIHRVNSLGKLNEVQRDGFKTIELDIKIVDGKLMVGHGEDGVMSGVTLADYFGELNLINIHKIWLDVKNLNRENISNVITELSEIEERFKVKSKLVVETQSKDYNISLLAQQGYNTSYYLPTYIADMDEDGQMQAAIKIAKQLKYQKVSSISFDSKLYDFVKTRLEKRMSPNIDYHTWNLKLDVRLGSFINDFKQEPYLLDKRLKTILVTYPSVFDL